MDVEKVFYSIVDFFKSNLNAKIEAINTEKNDPVLTTVSSNAWIEGSLNDTVVNYDRTILSYIEDIQANVSNSHISETIILEIDLIAHQKEDFLDYKRILRYQRALKEVAQDAWSGIKDLKGYDYPVVRILNPIDITIPGTSFSSKVIGVQIEFVLFN